MKMRIVILFFIFNCFYNEVFAVIENKIILKVENEIITNFEVKNKILSTLILSNQEINQQNIDNFKKQALEFLIQYKLKKIELSKFNLKNDSSQINNYLNSISGNDINKLKDTFKRNNIDFKLFVDEVETQFKWQQLIYKIYVNKIQIDEKSINKELEDIVQKESEIQEFKISEIEILLNGDDNDEGKISNVQKQINLIGFENAALKFSSSSSAVNKGDIGWINGKSLSKQIYEVIKNMNINEVSKPIKRSQSVLFLKLNDKKISKSNKINSVELKKNLIDRKKNDMFALYSKSHLSKLRNTSLIEYNK